MAERLRELLVGVVIAVIAYLKPIEFQFHKGTIRTGKHAHTITICAISIP